jgi:hypothetical protein
MIFYFYELIANEQCAARSGPLPMRDRHPLLTRASAIEILKTVDPIFEYDSLEKRLKKSETNCWGLSFRYDEINYPIFGYSGLVGEARLISHRAIEYEIYEQEGWTLDLEVEEIYSIEVQGPVKIIKHINGYAKKFHDQRTPYQ